MAKITRIPQTILLALLRAYQVALSPLLGHHCRFFPSCSQYMVDAIKAHGIMRGIYIGLKRLLRCHPFCKGGADPIPLEKKQP